MPVNPHFQSELVQMAQLRLSQRAGDTPITRQEIGETIDRLLAAFPEWREETSRDAATAHLEMIFSTFIGNASILLAEDGHVPWLNDRQESITWRYWERYRALLIRQQLPQPAINFLNRITDRILELCGNPAEKGKFDRRGMVVGDVQSGKTGNYTGLICKAADAGYKVIIVLAGLNNNLRSQTQIRLDEGFIGKISVPIGESGSRVIGAGQIDPSAVVDWATNRTEKGDFNWKVMSQFGVHPGGHPLLLVVKKNGSVLDSVLKWIDVTANSTEGGLKRFHAMPLLVIDDEADNASVDTRQQKFTNGIADPKHKPTSINAKIRQILRRFDQVSYVAYTATPFANIFIHPDAETNEEFQDLFPRDFIVNMPVPENYVGASKIFGYSGEVEEEEVSGLPELLVTVTDHADSLARKETQGWMPPVHKVVHVPLFNGEDVVPPSLRKAIQSFMLVVAARRERGQLRVHNSMLIHVTRYQAVQKRVIAQIQEALDQLVNEVRYGGEEGLKSFKHLWENEFEPVTQNLGLEDCPEVSWSALETSLRLTASSISVHEINGSSADVLDYELNRERGLNVIAVGGDKLARGLTLEGLSVTYFLRGSTMYDTLMQMGRWFGYRRGYLDLCRLFTTQDHVDWYGHIAQASDELRREFDRMEATHATPGQFGLRVRRHPALTVTSRAKMRHGTELQVSFAGDISETTVFSVNPDVLRQNHKAALEFVRQLSDIGIRQTPDPSQLRPGGRSHRWKGSHLWSGVPVDTVLTLLDRFSTHEDAARANTAILAKYIRTQVRKGELQEWEVLLVGGEGRDRVTFGPISVNTVVRQPKGGYGQDPRKPRVIGPEDRYVIRRLVNPRDEAVDLDSGAYESAFRKTLENPSKRRRRTDKDPEAPSGVYLRQHRPAERGLLMLYPLARTQELEHPDGGTFHHTFLQVDTAPLGLAISFPHSGNAGSVSYMVNSIYGVGDDDEGDA
ncbi:Z1 domain-containing protein [Rhizobium multihospitium]|uniref:Z1 domain-containing protein n=1 Tax=Rhizobium multihospitium TaxID=410764 RepID=A0A1C3VSL4_9HYPH|nr:Z1 domain-containing protein [Rhizobium multihospitium]SCB30709.1 Z1 domain-containing protein [Rhizobium multihospitium]